MVRKIVNITVCLVLGICAGIFIYNLCDYKSLKIDEGDVKQIQLNGFNVMAKNGFNITDKKEISEIVDYINSLKLYDCKNKEVQYDGPDYPITIKFKNNTQRSVCVEGTLCFLGNDKKTYDVGGGGFEADKVFGDIVQKEEKKRGEYSISGRVISVKGYEAGETSISLIIKDKNNEKFNVDMNKAITFDATGSGAAIISKGDLVRVTYWKKNKTDTKNINAVTVYIKYVDSSNKS